VQRHKRILFEVDELVWLPETVTRGAWGKGLWVEIDDAGLIRVGDLIVSHPGRQMEGYGANGMWAYEVDAEGRWTRVPTDQDCPRKHTWRHEQHLSALGILEQDLKERHSLVRRAN